MAHVDSWQAALSSDEGVRSWLRCVVEAQMRLESRSLDIAFRQVDADGNRIRQGAPEVAAALGLPERRCIAGVGIIMRFDGNVVRRCACRPRGQP